MRIPAIVAFIIACAACASNRPREFKLTPDGFQTAGAKWLLDPLADGHKMMPEGWEPVAEDDHLPVVVMRFKRVELDGAAVVVSYALRGSDQRKSLRALSERELTGFRMEAGQLLFGVVEPAKPVLLDGAEAQEGTYEMRRPGDYAPIMRLYASFAKSLANDEFMSIFYSSPPGQFDDGLPAVQGLVRRIHFRHDDPGVSR